ncbi:3-octaprenyl-4-hydroxybenzoate carboxy-lyase [Taibaiella sp. KBW10]|uniref:UbiD family decarboxylase n=1 Tax=Taibaiella sp. KBW10 TaxID=2153357 RepID=UPI000F590D1F|nr:UbiD family decarboxylase [Taibaiella sp. KBW10]RQO30914.1 3-octaprenyl-4-hydroxybenzoate carboxy-lyase [Taibaiella sp. KBW10]
MRHKSLEESLLDLEQDGQLVRIKEAVDPYLEMAALHLRVFEMGGPALLFENVIGSKFRTASNIFGTLARSKFLFRDTIAQTGQVIKLKNDPMKALKKPFKHLQTGLAAWNALPKQYSHLPNNFEKIKISDIPQIHHWPMDGGAFITLPQVYSEDIDKPGVMNANLGMYRVQLSGNKYIPNEEIGLHYQIHRGIGVHQQKANKKGQPLKVSIFIGGLPSHTLSAVMPLPEGLSELTFAGLLGGRRFRYSYEDGYCISHDADFVITGDIYPNETKPEGPFGDHLGYYSLTHPFPVMKVRQVYAKRNAIWPFTVVGRPPQEDTAFGDLIHELTDEAMPSEVPGVKEVHALDAAGVHPLLFAIGYERYTPYQSLKQPAEILTVANRILGTGQLSLAKYLFIAAQEQQAISTHKESEFLTYMLERLNLKRDIHFQTNTTIDTLDYSGTGLNTGSKVVFAACGSPVRALCKEVPAVFKALNGFENPQLALPGVVILQTKAFESYQQVRAEMERLNTLLHEADDIAQVPLIILADDAAFTAKNLKNFLWVTFTRSNPSHDIHGINSFYEHKHWGCDSLVIDARVKPHHAPPLVPDPEVTAKTDRFFEKGGSLAHLKNK